MIVDLSTDNFMIRFYDAQVKVAETSTKQIYNTTVGQSSGEC